LSFTSGNVSIFIHKEDAVVYHCKSPATFGTICNGTHKNIISPNIKIELINGEYTMTSFSSECEPSSIKLDALIPSSISGSKTITDQLTRAICYNAMMDKYDLSKREYPVTFNAKITVETSICLTYKHKKIDLDIGTVKHGPIDFLKPVYNVTFPGGKPSTVLVEEYTHIGTLGTDIVKDFLKISSSGTGILGVIPALRDIPEIWYLRTNNGTRSLIVF
jgi:hypothetical protein